MERRSFIKSLLSTLAALFAPAFVPRKADATMYLAPFVPTGLPQFIPHDVVLLGDQSGDGPTQFYSSYALGHNGAPPDLPSTLVWTNQPMGDYLDASGTLNGTNHYASTTFPNIGPWNVTALVQKMLVDGNTGFHMMSTTSGAPHIAGKTQPNPPVLSITTTTGTFSPPCTQSCWWSTAGYTTDNEVLHGYISIQSHLEGAACLKFDLSGVTGDVTSATLSVTVTDTPLPQNYVCVVNYLKMPALIWEPVRQIGPPTQGIAASVANDLALASHPSVIFYPDFSSQASIDASGFPGTSGAPPASHFPLPYTWSFPISSQYGIPLLRAGSNTSSVSILNWLRNVGGSYTELYMRYLLKLDPDLWVGLTNGCKLPGSDSSFFGNGDGDFSYRMEHLTQSIANQQAYGFYLHAYDATHTINANPSAAENRPMNPSVSLAAGKLYCIEQRVKLNTDNGAGVYNSDGIVQIWIDGVLMYSDTTRKIRADQNPIYGFFANIYQGGVDPPPSAPIHYEFGGVCIATQYIGPPKKVIPSWLNGVAVNQWVQIPNTKISDLAATKPAWSAAGIVGVQGPSAITSVWCGMSCDTRDSTLYELAGGGHQAYAGNQAIRIKLSVDAPMWEEAAPPSDGSQVTNNTDYYADGRPSSRHHYFGSQFIETRNRALCFGGGVWGGGVVTQGTISLNPSTGSYEPANTFPTCPDQFSNDVGIVKDPATEDIYIWDPSSDRLARWIQATNRWVINVLDPAVNHQSGNAIAVDTRRNRIFTPSVYYGAGVYNAGTVNLGGALPWAIIARTLTGDTSFFPNPPGGENGYSLVFVPHPTDPTQDCFLCRRRNSSAANPIRINASTFFVDTLTTTGGSSIPADVGGGVYNRFLMTGLNGIAYVPNWDANIWFLRTS